jgi:lipopolysaccharide transport system ATP-binding protein
MMTRAESSGPPLVSLRNVGVAYWLKSGLFTRDKYWALQDVSFDLYRGESLGIIGRNGCGKSTLLRLLADVMSPDQGVITGADKVRTALLSLNLGFVDYLSGRENAILSGMFLGLKHREIVSRLPDIIAFSELGEFIDRPLASYSSGMRARLGFAVAFQIDPDILLVDEVSGVGDIAFRDKSFQVMQERLQSRNNTIVFVSHQASQIKNLCDRVIWLDKGRVRAAGPVDEIVEEYQREVRSIAKAKAVTAIPTSPKDGMHAEDSTHVFVRLDGSKNLYEVSEGKRRLIKSMAEFRELGGQLEDVHILPKDIFVALQEEADGPTRTSS